MNSKTVKDQTVNRKNLMERHFAELFLIKSFYFLHTQIFRLTACTYFPPIIMYLSRKPLKHCQVGINAYKNTSTVGVIFPPVCNIFMDSDIQISNTTERSEVLTKYSNGSLKATVTTYGTCSRTHQY